MSKTCVPVALGLILVAVPAFAHPPSVLGEAPASASRPRDVTELQPIVVKGHKIYLPVALQMIKAALKRPVNYRSENWDKLVCRFESPDGSRAGTTLRCDTECELWARNMAIQGVHVSSELCGLKKAETGIAVAGWVRQRRINRGALMAVLSKLPPADSSYTLRVTEHGKVVAEYVFKDGDLVHVYKANHENTE
jgi:hypothetical protein